jgi:hypothetical protein
VSHASGSSPTRPTNNSFFEKGEPEMRDSRHVLPILHRVPLFLSTLVGAALAIGTSQPAGAETINVPCDVLALASVITTVNTNGEEDEVWLAPSCEYRLPATWRIEADLGSPVRIYGRAATISGNEQRTALLVVPGATVHLYDVTVSDGVAENLGGFRLGGGIRNEGTLTLTDSTVTRNTAGHGGGIYNVRTLRLTRSTVSDNQATAAGGGIDNDGAGRLTLIGSTVSGNGAPHGGGILNLRTATLFNSTLYGNGGFVGGGLLNDSGAMAVLGHTTISDNSAELDGGGIRNDAALELDNSLLANNSGGDCSNTGTLMASGGNLVEDGSCAIAGALTGDPGLFGLAGGEPAYLPLLPGSPAIDAGDDSSCPSTDQRGAPRPQDGGRDGTRACDLGAYESACGLLGIELFLVLPMARALARARRS